MNRHVTIHEVGPRDGLQNESGVISVAQKVALIQSLAKAGLTQIEVGSFVSPKWVPQMADTEKVMASLQPLYRGQYDVLVPNKQGWDRFAAASGGGGYGIAVFISASEGFSLKNLNCSIDESIARLAPVIAAANAADVPVRGYVSCVTDCPYDGSVSPDAVAFAVQKLRALSPMPISLGDTIGIGTPEKVTSMLQAVLGHVPAGQLAGHFHDTNLRAIENIEVSLALGLRSFDSAIGGLGGCPFAPGAPGNVATEAVVAYLHKKGYETGVDLNALKSAAAMAHDIRRKSDEKFTS